MKAGIKTAVVTAAMLTATVVTEARPQQDRQQKRDHAVCPKCGQTVTPQQPFQARQGQKSRQWNPQRQQRWNQGNRDYSRGPARRFQQERGPRQFQNRRGQEQQYGNQRFAPRQQGQNFQSQQRRQQRPQLNMQQRRMILEKFDRDGDGKLSQEERNSAKQAWQKHHRQPKQDSNKEQQQPMTE